MASTSLMSLGLPRADLHPRDLPRAIVPGLYVHVPFCFHKCHYCDFYSITRQTPERMSRFVDLVLREAEMWTGPDLPVVRPRTVFFGGGTPSLLPLEQMRRLIDGLRERFDFSELNEWTIEVNPATASLEYLKMLRDSRVDRLSFGAQSFDREELRVLERHHDPEDVPRSIEWARSARFDRLNVDLIYAIPGQTIESWNRSLDAAIALKIPHISAYNLTYEPNTPIAVKKRLGQLIATDEAVEVSMLKVARSRLTASGRAPYEISNYAEPGEDCRHNLLYWTGGSYVGLGPSAASHVEGTRFKNRPHLGEWEQAIEAGHLPAQDVETLSQEQRRGELVMLMLRLTRGVNYAEYSARIGSDARTDFAEQLDSLSKLQLIHTDNRGFHLTDQGLNVADSIGGEFLVS
jgi:oxygen-independent coproporphyrinogen-3 oxidase